MLRRTVPIAGAENQRFELGDRTAHYHVPGVSIAVIENCRIVDARGFGLKSWGDEPVTPGTLFQAGSISTSATAVGALRLVEKGVLGLDEGAGAGDGPAQVAMSKLSARASRHAAP